MAVNRFIYPRTITIRRPEAPTNPGQPAIGKQPYQGVRRDIEEPVVLEVPASIQYAGAGRAKGGELPSDPSSLATWKILTPPGFLQRDDITERDVLTDDLGKRYQVQAAYWSPLGFNARVTLLQV